MLHLADIQQRMRDAVVTGEEAGIASVLVGGRDGIKRLAIHQRHYVSSLVKGVVGKFPGTTWLVGTSFVTDAARRFVRQHPPNAPCIAEYGEYFPEFLSQQSGADSVPYLGSFAKLEWHIGHAAVAVDRAALTFDEFLKVDSNSLPDLALVLQPGLQYLRAEWPIDELMKLYLTETPPDGLELAGEGVWLEVCGSRGQFHINRLSEADFIFRKSVSDSRTIGDAAECALDVHASFDPGHALAALIAAGHVTEIHYM